MKNFAIDGENRRDAGFDSANAGEGSLDVLALRFPPSCGSEKACQARSGIRIALSRRVGCMRRSRAASRVVTQNAASCQSQARYGENDALSD
jgi:hypothetical protein